MICLLEMIEAKRAKMDRLRKLKMNQDSSPKKSHNNFFTFISLIDKFEQKCLLIKVKK